MLCAAIGMGLHAVLRSIAAFAIFIVAGLDSAAGFVPQYFCPNRNGACASATLFLAAQRWHTWRSLKSRHLQPSSFMSDRRRVPWSGVRTHQAFDGLPLDGSYQGHQPQHSNGMETHSDWGVKMEDDDVDDEGDRAPSAGYAEGIGMGSTEFVNLVKAQFDVLAAMLDVSQIVLLVRRENIETGALEFVPAMVYPERSRVLIMDADGIQVQEGPKELPWTENAADVLPNYPFISVRKRGDEWETPDAVENDDGGLSAPLMYASMVMGMITVWKKDTSVNTADLGTDGEVVYEDEMMPPGRPSAERPEISEKPAVWSERDKDMLEKISSSVAIAAVLDQKQHWAAVVQVEQLRRILAESLHQVKNPMTALRTFGKLLLRRLPRDDTLNRELAKDIILQSDRVVDLLLPVDSVVGLLAQAMDEADADGGINAVVRPYPLIEGKPPATFAVNAIPDEPQALNPPLPGATIHSSISRDEKPSGSTTAGGPASPGSVQDALLSRPPGEDEAQSPLSETPPDLHSLSEPEGSLRLLFVQDVVEPVTRAAQAVAQARRVCFRWRVDDDLPGVLGDERALEDALSNVVDNALKYCKMGKMDPGSDDKGGRATVVLRARPSTDKEWGADSGVVIEVVDNGPGVAPDDLPHIFERGYRGRQPREHNIPGTGLGLGIAREMMLSMGGDLQVTNKGGEDDGWGAGVKLFLPRHRRRGN